MWGAATRFGRISFSVDAQEQAETRAGASESPLRLVTRVTLVLHGRGFVANANGGLAVAVRLRDPLGRRVLRSAVATGDKVVVTEVDSAGECVVVEVPRGSGAEHALSQAEGPRTVAFTLVAVLQ